MNENLNGRIKNDFGCIAPETIITGISSSFPKFIPIPECPLTFEEQAKQMRINADIIMQEITDHITKEIARFENHFKLANIKFERENHE